MDRTVPEADSVFVVVCVGILEAVAEQPFVEQQQKVEDRLRRGRRRMFRRLRAKDWPDACSSRSPCPARPVSDSWQFFSPRTPRQFLSSAETTVSFPWPDEGHVPRPFPDEEPRRV